MRDYLRTGSFLQQSRRDPSWVLVCSEEHRAVILATLGSMTPEGDNLEVQFEAYAVRRLGEDEHVGEALLIVPLSYYEAMLVLEGMRDAPTLWVDGA